MRDFAPVDPAVPSRQAGRRRSLAWLGGGALGLLAWPALAARKPVGLADDPGRKLPAVLRARLQASGLPLSSFGLYAEPVDGGRPLVALNASEPFVMASTAKVVTSLAALDLLGPKFRWRTQAYLRGLLTDGHLYGDLIIVGGGDVTLSTDDLRAWFERMQSMGLHHVHGRILLDRAAFQLHPSDFANTPAPAPDRPHHMHPNALMLDSGLVHVEVQTARGGRPQVEINPPLQGVRVLNNVKTQGGCSAYASFKGRGRYSDAPQLQVQGNWSSACGSREITFAPLSVEELTLRAVGELWREAGGELTGDVQDHTDAARNSVVPEARPGESLVFWSVHGSDDLTRWIHGMNKVSDNVAARHLMLSLSPGFPRRPATLAGAQSRVRRWLLKQGLDGDDVVLENGSGLSRAEKAKPRALVQLLRQAWIAPYREAFIDSLPVAGVDGTLSHRLTQRHVQGQAHLKTGTLLDARALAGYVHAQSGQWYAVTALANHPEAALATPALDGFIDWLATQG